MFTNPFLFFLSVGVFLAVLVGLAIYIYWAMAYMTIAKKLKYDKPWLAWIPFANMFLVTILAGKKWYWGFLFFVPFVNIAFLVLWTWRIYERRNYPGWLSLIPLAGLIPAVGLLASLTNLVILGFVAWKDR